MPDNCKHWKDLIAEHALTARSPVDHDLDAHVMTCTECTATVAEFRGIAAALSHTAAGSKPTAPRAAPSGLDERITARLHHARTKRRAARIAVAFAIGGTVAAAVFLVLTFASIHTTTPVTPIEQVALVAGAVHGDAQLEPRAWGTQIHLAGTGFTPGQQYNLWLEKADGTHIPAGTFNGVRNTRITVTLASSLSAADAVAIGLSTPNGNLIVRVALN